METTPPSHSKGRELTQSGAEAILNLVPVVGGTIATALTVALNYRLNERRERWFSELADAVADLQDRFDGFDPESLVDNEQFLDAVVTATRTVDRSSQREKIEALRNAVLNAALPGAPDHDIQQLYLGLVDDLTPTHLRLLKLLNDPPSWFAERPQLRQPQFGLSSNRVGLIAAAMPDLAEKGQQLVERFYAALTDGGLVNGPLQGMMTGDGAWQSVTTEFAADFLAFIRDPRSTDTKG
jgi:hypothetical protein